MTQDSTLKEREKQAVALSSVLAAIGLTGMKIVVGLATGSLGILAEAAHSGLDLVAAVMTLLAVKISDRPADREHPYGHGKVENLSALGETLLLLLTCGWIMFEALRRLFFRPVEVEVTVWSFLVMIVSIGVDLSRSRMLLKAAKKHRSPALEADALHFSTDVWSSSVVLVGLTCMVLGRHWLKLASLHQADALAALVVALIVIAISVRLGRRTVQGLLDAAPAGVQEQIRAAVEAMPDVANCHHVRLRYAGAQPFVDIHILVYGNKALKEVHHLTDDIERVIQNIVPQADVTIHPEPQAESRTGGEVPPGAS